MGMDWEQKWIVLQWKIEVSQRFRLRGFWVMNKSMRNSRPCPASEVCLLSWPKLPSEQSSLKVCSEEACYWMRCCHDLPCDTFVFKVIVSSERMYLECWGQLWSKLRAACPWWFYKPKGTETQALFVSEFLSINSDFNRKQIPQFDPEFPDSESQQQNGSPFARHHVIIWVTQNIGRRCLALKVSLEPGS